MLATLLRHTGRLDEATRQLDTLARLEGAGKWELEIRQERELLKKAKTSDILKRQMPLKPSSGRTDNSGRQHY